MPRLIIETDTPNRAFRFEVRGGYFHNNDMLGSICVTLGQAQDKVNRHDRSCGCGGQQIVVTGSQDDLDSAGAFESDGSGYLIQICGAYYRAEVH